MLHRLIDTADAPFTTCDQVRPLIKQACAANPEIASYEQLGNSEEGHPIDAVILGTGRRRVSLIAGAHSDEPVGPETLRTFILQLLAKKESFHDSLTKYQFLVVPHINPDGEARNQAWKEAWPSIEAYLQHSFREPPGRDLEFGFPDMRAENKYVSDFLSEHAPFVMHMSLHGMAFSEGAMLLIERHWIERTQELQDQFVQVIQKFGLGLHDHDRKGEKGFLYIAPGFTTTPEGSAMRRHFEGLGDQETASCFHHSSMEFVRSLGGDPLCLVTELPLFVIGKKVEPRRAGIPQAYLDFKDRLTELRRRINSPLQGGAASAAGGVSPIADTLNAFQIEPVQLGTAMTLQLHAIQLGLEAVERSS